MGGVSSESDCVCVATLLSADYHVTGTLTELDQNRFLQVAEIGHNQLLRWVAEICASPPVTVQDRHVSFDQIVRS